MALPALLVKIGADTQGLDSALGKARRGFAGLAKAAAASGVLVAGAFTAMAVQGLRAVDANTKLARSIDGTINGLRAVQIAASYAGVGVGEANTAIQQLNRELVSAREAGTPAHLALQRIGFVADQLSGLDTDDRMAAIADRMRELGLSSAEASDILRDLGVRSRNMALLLVQGGDAIRSAREEVRDFGLELTDAQTDAIEAANDSISRMTLVFEGLRNKLAAELAPALQAAADRFNAIAQSDSVQAAIERLAEAFGSLSEIILSEDFMGVAIRGLEGLVNISAGVADTMVTVAENIEVVTLALSALAIAVAAAGGPFTVLIGVLAAALGGIAAWRAKIRDAEKPTTAAQAAIVALNTALAIVPGSAEAAGRSAIDLANDNYELAESALAAAEAQLAQSRAAAAAAGLGGASESGPVGPRTPKVLQDLRRDAAALEQLEAHLAAARARLDSTSGREVAGSDYETTTPPPPPASGTNLPSVFGPDDELSTNRPRSRADAAYDEYFGPLPAGLGGADQLEGELAQRLEVLTAGLASESELLAEWYAAGQETLAEAREQGLLSEAEYKAQLERLEEEHQGKLLGIKEKASNDELKMRKATQKAALSLLTQFGTKNKALAKLAVAVNAAQRVSEIAANTAAASTRALAELGPIAGPPVAARIKAYGALQAGIATASAALNIGGSGGGSGGGGGAFGVGPQGGSGDATGSAGAEQRRVAEYRVEGTNVRGLQELADDINEAQRQGYMIEIVGR